jgi:flagellar biosynthesis protein FlhA
VASTRVVLLNGHTGTNAAGRVIEAFGEFVIGGNYAVGAVVFTILVIINFVVVTKGAGRISEVSARFTLDAMPGKQMAIDADLNAGLITQDEARARRAEVTSEADFYGSMDGASKFVRGDAVAGILILFINMLGGLGIGMIQHDMAFGDALRNYTLLTIGDGLVAQLPSLLLSVSAAILVTRVSTSQDMSRQIATQMFDNPRVLYVAAGVLGIMGILPGMPNLAFLTLALAAGAMAYMISQRRQIAAAAPVSTAVVPEAVPAPESRDVSWDDVRSEERRVGKECRRLCRSRWSPYH